MTAPYLEDIRRGVRYCMVPASSEAPKEISELYSSRSETWIWYQHRKCVFVIVICHSLEIFHSISCNVVVRYIRVHRLRSIPVPHFWRLWWSSGHASGLFSRDQDHSLTFAAFRYHNEPFLGRMNLPELPTRREGVYVWILYQHRTIGISQI